MKVGETAKGEEFYNSMIRNSFADSKREANKIKQNWNKKTDPVTLAGVKVEEVKKPSIYKEMYFKKAQNKDERPARRVFKQKNNEIFNNNHHQPDEMERLKYKVKQQEEKKERELMPRKRLFPDKLKRDTAVVIQRGVNLDSDNKLIKTENRRLSPEGTREPSQYVVKMNDRQKLLPFEYHNRYNSVSKSNRRYSARNSTVDNVKLALEEKVDHNLSRENFKRRDNSSIGDILGYKYAMTFRDENITAKVV